MNPAIAGMLAPIPAITIGYAYFWMASGRDDQVGILLSVAYPVALLVAVPIGTFSGLLLHRWVVWRGASSYLACACLASVIAAAPALSGLFNGQGVPGMALWGAISGVV